MTSELTDNTVAMHALSRRLEQFGDDLTVLNRVLLGDPREEREGLLKEHLKMKAEHDRLMGAFIIGQAILKMIPRLGIASIALYVLSGNETEVLWDLVGGLLR